MTAPLRFDVHVHLAGVGTGGSGCWASDSFRRRFSFVGLRLLYGIRSRQLETTIDQDWPAAISGLVQESELDYAVVLGFDGVYDRSGRWDGARSQLLVPDPWVFSVCERYGNLLPAPSINPMDGDALVRLDESIARGAVLIKWLPIVQAFDPGDRSITPFLARVAEAGIPLVVHAGTGESTFATIDPSMGSLGSLVPALEMGVKVIVAHGAAPVIYSRAPSEMGTLREMLERYPNLWIDNSGLANPARFPYLKRIADDDLLSSRVLHGSDFPVAPSPALYPLRLGPKSMIGLMRDPNPIRREVRLKEQAGFAPESFTRAAGVLANLDRWATPS